MSFQSPNDRPTHSHMVVGTYRVSGVIGEGGSAIVYDAYDAQNRNFALKVLRPDLELGPKERQRFVDEAERMRRVRHPSIVEVVEAGVLPDGRPFIAMPRLVGQSMFERLRQGPIRFDVALTLFEQLADALRVLHSAGLVHRDIKPENIFVVAGDTRALLLDLGIARDMSAAASTTTRAGMIRGTPAYMAPERFFGKPATPASDIYELAVVLYLVLVGRLPWRAADDPTERLSPIPPAQQGVVLPPRLATTLMRALASQAAERPRTPDELTNAVHDAVSPESAALISGQRTTDVRPRTQPVHAVPSAPPIVHTQAAPAAYAPPAQAASGAMPMPMSMPVHSAAPTPQRRTNIMPVLIAVAAAGLAVLALATWNVVARQIAPPHKRRGVVQSGELPCCKQLNELYCKNQPKPCQGMNTEIPELMPASAIEETNQNCCRAYEKITHPR